MKITTYEQRDLIPLTISVLGTISFFNACNTLKYLVETEFCDLKGLISTDTLDDSSIALLDVVDNDFHKITYDSMTGIYETAHSLANIYGLDIGTIIRDERLTEMGEDFVLELIVDQFPEDNFVDEDFEPAESLDLFAFSLVNVVNFLCSMLLAGKVDFDLSWTSSKFYLDFLSEDYSGKEHATALQLLQELGSVLSLSHGRILDLLYNNGDICWDDP
ncbi:hypothetical protein [Pedobacter hartonius]|uniref:Uncharacterized protein n=1 Tax=Pedobacter hartonius TaxID=425514 RepID=A0A1H3WC71_9SPHI|nr:hypothetical protein [Pedobacter hartonius]SDZ84675.1 hypothetical protein SAMN05443550_101189 [Pedobacter hartonius]